MGFEKERVYGILDAERIRKERAPAVVRKGADAAANHHENGDLFAGSLLRDDVDALFRCENSGISFLFLPEDAPEGAEIPLETLPGARLIVRNEADGGAACLNSSMARATRPEMKTRSGFTDLTAGMSMVFMPPISFAPAGALTQVTAPGVTVPTTRSERPK